MTLVIVRMCHCFCEAHYRGLENKLWLGEQYLLMVIESNLLYIWFEVARWTQNSFRTEENLVLSSNSSDMHPRIKRCGSLAWQSGSQCGRHHFHGRIGPTSLIWEFAARKWVQGQEVPKSLGFDLAAWACWKMTQCHRSCGISCKKWTKGFYNSQRLSRTCAW